METRLTNEQPLKWHDRLSTKVAAGSLALAATLTLGGIKTYDYLRDSGDITPRGWNVGQGVEVVDTDCNTVIDGTHCDLNTTWKIRYRQCEDDDFPVDKDGNPPLKTPDDCVDWTKPNVLHMPPGVPVLYPDNTPAHYPYPEY